MPKFASELSIDAFCHLSQQSVEKISVRRKKIANDHQQKRNNSKANNNGKKITSTGSL